MQEFNNKFKIKEYLICSEGAWNISLRPQQITLGSLILSLNRQCETLDGLTPEEGKDLAHAFQVISKILDAAFKPEKLNYLALMMVDNQVHFHVVPRYSEEVEFKGKSFVDTNWPAPPNVLNALEIKDSELLEIKEYMTDMFNLSKKV